MKFQRIASALLCGLLLSAPAFADDKFAAETAKEIEAVKLARDTQAAGYPMLTFTVDDQALTAVAAQSAEDPDSFGFRWEYDPTAPVVADVPTDWADASTICGRRPTWRRLGAGGGGGGARTGVGHQPRPAAQPQLAQQPEHGALGGG